MIQPETKTAPKSAFTVKETCYAGLFAAVIAIMAQISIPMPGGVPMTMQTFAVTLAAIVLGAKLSTVSTVIYLILGAAGVPVLAGFTGGLAKFDQYYQDGLIDRILTTNLVYQTPDLLSRPYYIDVDMSKYIALIIDNLNHDASLSDLLTPTKRINKLLERYKEQQAAKNSENNA